MNRSNKKQLIKILIFALCSTILFFIPAKRGKAQGTINGKVKDSKTGTPLANANLVLSGTPYGSTTGRDGRYEIKNVPAGKYSLEVSFIGYKTIQMKNVTIKNGQTLRLNFELIETPVKLREIIVTPGYFSISGELPNSRQVLSKETLQNISLFGGDAYRSMIRLPGVTGNDFSAKFAIRGGGTDEVLVLFDGLELYDPYHLKDIGGGVMSIIDLQAIGGIELLTGGFTSVYGNKLSGVFNVHSSISTLQENRTSVGISLLNSRFHTHWQSPDRKDRFILSARRGYLDLLMKMTGNGNSFLPEYFDLLGIYERQLSRNFLLTTHFLYAGDQFKLKDDNSNNADTGYKNLYGWTTLRSQLCKRVRISSILSAGYIKHDRDATVVFSDGKLNKSVSDERYFYFAGIKQDWSIEPANSLFLRFGIDARTYHSNYQYLKNNITRIISPSDTSLVLNQVIYNLKPEGSELGLYLSQRVQLFSAFTLEFGGRFDRQSFTNDKSWSPRINAAYSLGNRTVLKGGWGNFYQTQNIHQLDVVDDVTKFYPQELAEHRVLGLEHQFMNGINLRIEVYRKKLKDIRPKFINLIGTLDVFPELSGDRTQEKADFGETRGMEFYIKQDIGAHYSWWMSYSYAEAKDWIVSRYVYRPFDQKHTVDININYKPSSAWQFNLAWQFHSGWPYTEMILETEPGPEIGTFKYILTSGSLRAARLSAYHRLDIRVSRNFRLSWGNVNVFLELINAYNRKNIKTVDYGITTDDDGNTKLDKLYYYWLPILPSAGLSWEF